MREESSCRPDSTAISADRRVGHPSRCRAGGGDRVLLSGSKDATEITIIGHGISGMGNVTRRGCEGGEHDGPVAARQPDGARLGPRRDWG